MKKRKWAPPVAIQTIFWGARPNCGTQKMLKQIKEAGYAGVEFHQHPQVIAESKKFDDCENVYNWLEENDLVLVGLAGGSLREKARFLKGFLKHVSTRFAHDTYARRYENFGPYIYVEECTDEDAATAVEYEATLALHPHMFRAVQTAQDAETRLNKYPDLRFLPDTAHLTVAGEEIVPILKRNYDRIEAIHLKNWTADFGRAYQFYSRGFIELGPGDVGLHEILEFLRDEEYARWLVVEQEACDNPFESAKESREWLRTWIVEYD